MTVLRNLDYLLDVTLAMEDIITTGEVWNSMDSNGIERPLIGFWHIGGSSWDSKRKEEPVRILTGKRDQPGFQQDGRRRVY